MYPAITDLRLANAQLTSDYTQLRTIALWLLDMLIRLQHTATRKAA